MLAEIEEARRETLQLFYEGRAKGYPVRLSHFAVKLLLKERGIVAPDDIVAWVSEGKASDKQVTNWDSPVGV